VSDLAQQLGAVSEDEGEQRRHHGGLAGAHDQLVAQRLALRRRPHKPLHQLALLLAEHQVVDELEAKEPEGGGGCGFRCLGMGEGCGLRCLGVGIGRGFRFLHMGDLLYHEI
jgi:hypothetical protein